MSTVTARRPPPTSPASSSLPVQGASTYYQAFPVPVRAADDSLPSVLQVPLIDGRWLNSADTQLHTAIGGPRDGHRQAVRLPARRDPDDPAQRRQLRRGRRPRLRGARSRPRQRRLRHPVGGASTSSAPTASPTSSTSAPTPGTTQATANAIPTAINLGGPEPGVDPDPERRAAGGGAGQQDAAAGGAPRRSAGAHRRRDRHRQRHVDLGHPAVVRDRHPPGRRPQPVQDRRPVPARVAVRRRARRAGRCRCRRRRRLRGLRLRRTGSW